MRFLEHLDELQGRLLKILWVFLPFFVFYMTFSVRLFPLDGFAVPYVWPSFFDSVSVQIVRTALGYYLPDFVEPVQLTPAEAILIQFKVAIFLSILTTMPVIVYQLSRFVAPGLYPHEKRIIAKITIPATLLFLGGVLIAHFLILPFVFDFLYRIGANLGLRLFASPDQVFDVVLLFFLGMGLAFQTPIVMWGLTALGVVDPDVWKKYWRGAIVAFFIFGAVITPDGSGITMMLVAGPMTVLYAVGYVASNRTWKARHGLLEERKGHEGPRIVVWSLAIVLVTSLVGGYLYFNTSLLRPPSETVSTHLAANVTTLELPAFVLYTPSPLSPDMSTRTSLRATNGTSVDFVWTADVASGLPLAFESSEVGTADDASRMRLTPVDFLGSNHRSLEASATDGQSGVLVLRVQLAYDLFLRTHFADANRNGVLDDGEAVESRTLVFRYATTPLNASLRPLETTGLMLPAPQDRTLLDRGVFSALGPGWDLEVAFRDLLEGNDTYTTPVFAQSLALSPGDVDLVLSRAFQWDSSASLRFRVTGGSATAFTYSWYLDHRFGTLFPTLAPA